MQKLLLLFFIILIESLFYIYPVFTEDAFSVIPGNGSIVDLGAIGPGKASWDYDPMRDFTLEVTTTKCGRVTFRIDGYENDNEADKVRFKIKLYYAGCSYIANVDRWMETNNPDEIYFIFNHSRLKFNPMFSSGGEAAPFVDYTGGTIELYHYSEHLTNLDDNNKVVITLGVVIIVPKNGENTPKVGDYKVHVDYESLP